MILSGISEPQILAAIQALGIAGEIEPKGRRYRVKLGPGQSSFRRVGRSGRRVSALCWHGFRDFLALCYAQAPEMTAKTAMANYDGKVHFLATFRETGAQNIGSRAEPLAAANACQCWEGYFYGDFPESEGLHREQRTRLSRLSPEFQAALNEVRGEPGPLIKAN